MLPTCCFDSCKIVCVLEDFCYFSIFRHIGHMYYLTKYKYGICLFFIRDHIFSKILLSQTEIKLNCHRD